MSDSAFCSVGPFRNGGLFYVGPVPSQGSPPPNPTAIFADQALTIPAANPDFVNAGGTFGFWVTPGQYILEMPGQGFAQVITIGIGTGGSVSGVTSLNSMIGDITIIAGSNVTLTPVGNGFSISAAGTGAVSFADAEAPSGSKPGTAFTLAHTPNPAASLQLVWNGITLSSGGVGYTLSGTSVTMVTTVQSGDSLVCWYRY